MFTEQEKQLIVWGKANNKTQQEIEQALIRLRTRQPPKQVKEQPATLSQRIAEDITSARESIAQKVEAGRVIGAGIEATAKGIGLPFKIAGETIAEVTPEPVGEAVKTGLKSVYDVSALKPVVNFLAPKIQEIAEKYPEQTENITNLLETVVNAFGYKGLVELPVLLKSAKKELGETIIKPAVERTEKVVTPIVKTAEELAERGVMSVTEATERAAINIAAKKAEQAAIAALPEIGQKAVRSGIAVQDVDTILGAAESERAAFKNLAKTAKEYAVNRSTKDPAELVGQEFRKRITALESEQGNVGQKLGQLAKDIPSNAVDKVKTNVLEAMNDVPGLKGIRLDEKGLLDFTDTTLSGSLTKADRKVLQQAFNDLSGRNPLQLHKLRQELFEVLGGKKSAKVVLTETQEKGLEAIRKGLSDVLDAANPGYKSLNTEYARVSNTLKGIRKYFKNVAGADVDILDEAAGKLARRLTSNAPSAPEIRQLIRDTEKILSEKGVKFDVSVDSMQNFLNMLNRYYDIAAETGLAGQVKLGIGEIPTTMTGLITTGIKKAAEPFLQTKAVQQKAFEDLLGL